MGSFIFYKTDDLKTIIENGVFEVNSSRVKGIVGFIKDKTYSFDFLTIKSNENGAVFIYSPEGKSLEDSDKLMLVTMSEVKDKTSGWGDSGRFNWGDAPTLLKKMSVNISLNVDGGVEVYALDTKGTRGMQIKTDLEECAIAFSTENSYSPWFEISAK